MFERTIDFCSLPKQYAIIGWRLGHICTPAEIIGGFR
jgi:aspartate/methionine/tyrosine aminotransferase